MTHAGNIGRALLLASAVALAACRPDGDSVGLTASGDEATASFAASAFANDAAPVTAFSGRPDRIADPSVDDIMQAGPLGEMSLGRADAPVTMIEYASLTCPHCRAFHEQTWPAFKRNYVDSGKVRYILREFPIGRSSGNAWLITRCAGGDRSFKLFDLYLKKQSRWVSQDVRLDQIFAIASEAGVSRSEFDACLEDQKTIDAIKWVKDRGRRLGVIGTPTFFLNGEQFRTVPTIGELSQRIDPLLSARVASSGGNAVAQ